MTLPQDYSSVTDSERALKYAIQHIAADRAEIIEGAITLSSRPERTRTPPT